MATAVKLIPTVTHSEPELNEAFKRVRSLEDWRTPIDVIILEPDPAVRKLIAEAVTFYTSTEAEFIKLHGHTYRVRADGYWNEPAGP